MLAFAPLLAAAQEAGGACRPDAQKYCKTVKPGDGRIVDCLIDHQKEISDDCYDALKKQLMAARANSGKTSAGDAPAPAPVPAGPVYRSRGVDGRTVYSDTPMPNAAEQREVPMDRVISVTPAR